MKPITRFSIYLLAMALTVACSKDETSLPPVDELSDATKKSSVVVETPIQLTGFSLFHCYAPKSGITHMDGGLPCEATLTPIGGQWYQLDASEFLPAAASGAPIDTYRHVSFKVKMTPGGSLKFCWPETWYDFFNDPSAGQPNTDVIDQVFRHTGCLLSGPGISKGTLLYTGKFDGNVFKASVHFKGKQVDPEPEMPPYYNIDGPALFEFAYEMTVTD